MNKDQILVNCVKKSRHVFQGQWDPCFKQGMMKLNLVTLENMGDEFRGGYDWKPKDQSDPCYKANER